MAEREIQCPNCGHRFQKGGEDTVAPAYAAQSDSPPVAQASSDRVQKNLLRVVIFAVCVMTLVSIALAAWFGYTIYGMNQLINDVRAGGP